MCVCAIACECVCVIVCACVFYSEGADDMLDKMHRAKEFEKKGANFAVLPSNDTTLLNYPASIFCTCMCLARTHTQPHTHTHIHTHTCIRTHTTTLT